MIDVDVDVIVLDVDDTLYLERHYVRSGFLAVGDHIHQQFGLAGFGQRCWELFEAGHRGNTFDLAVGEFRVPTDVHDLVTHYRSHRPEISLCSDARRFLGKTGKRASALITDGPTLSQRAKIEALGLGDCIQLLIVTDEYGSGWAKPSNSAFLLVMEQLQARPERCVYIADNPTKDFVAPTALGWKSIRIRRPQSLHEDLVTPEHVTQICTFDELRLSQPRVPR